KKLEYRGYDSCGIAIGSQDLKLFKKAGNVENLKKHLDFDDEASVAIGHTRWATHGSVNDSNAHPFIYKNFAMVLNGIVENYESIKSYLIAKNYHFTSETDAEALLLYIADYLNDHSLEECIKFIRDNVEGNFSFLLLNNNDGGLFGMKNGLQLALGIAPDLVMIASDKMAFPKQVNEVMQLENGDAFIIKENNITVINLDDEVVPRRTFKYEFNSLAIDKNGYETFMMKEINEQALCGRSLLANYNVNKKVLSTLDKIKKLNVKSIHIIGCGSSYYAGMQFKSWCREHFDYNVEVSIASEFYFYKNFSKADLYILISQSGETKDTLLCAEKLSHVRDKLLSIVNSENSTLESLCEMNLAIYAGKEIGVASTKAFFNQLLSLFLITNNFLKSKNEASLNYMLDKVEMICEENLYNKQLISVLKKSKKIILSSRATLYPITLEIALKVKELSYISVESIPSGEMKHGSISLMDEDTSVIFFITSDCPSFQKILININEVHLRGARVIIVGDKKSIELIGNKAYENVCIDIKNIDLTLQPFLYLIEGQKLSYYLAKELGNNIDMPRNLAKSVTVE
ncbi:MAG: glutamine--fructose-6-phosphate transaminase (isomerizing), partial [Alphaproteobacteria bacterium]|nr:glutamine--fructose-6-phosphate transaminase (isomerizing) [Alphaproteobacteria bacterium]